MSIQRYRSDGQGDCDLGGMYVLYTDHVAALLTQDRQHGEQSHGHYMVDPDNADRLLKIPPSVVAEIKAEALTAALQGSWGDQIVWSDDALAAIDALRGES